MYLTPTTLQLTALGEAPTLDAIRRTLGDPRRLDFETRVELRLFADERAARWPEPARALLVHALAPPEPEHEASARSAGFSLRRLTPVELPAIASQGPSIAQLHESALGTCGFLTTLSGIAENQPHLLRPLVTNDGDGTNWVRFYRRDERRRPLAEFVQLDGPLPPKGPNGLYAPASAATWLGLVDRAHTLWKTPASRANADFYFELTGTPGAPRGLAVTREPSAFRRVAAALSSRVTVTASSAPPFLRPPGLQLPGIIGLHAFTVIDVMERNQEQRLALRNPWGIQPPFVTPRGLVESRGAGVFELTWQEFRAAFPFVYVAA